MSTFQKLLHRFLGQIEGSYNPNTDGNEPMNSFAHRQPLEKVVQSRRQRSLEALKSASCLSCGISKEDRQMSMTHIEKVTPVVNKSENHHINDRIVAQQQQQIIKQKRRRKNEIGHYSTW